MKIALRKLVLGLGMIVAMAGARADLVTPLVSLQENAINDANGNWLMNQYAVTNNSPYKEHDIYAFAVTNSLAMNAWTTREGWVATTMTKNEWNTGGGIKTFCDDACRVIYTGSAPSDTEYSGLYLGSFESLFGTEESYVNFYWSHNGIAIYHGFSADEFYFSAPPASQYAAFGLFGTVFQSVNNVPEPHSLALLGVAALAGLTVVRRRHTH
jgi:hypothetical protein